MPEKHEEVVAEPEVEVMRDLNQLVSQAREGDESVLAALQQLLDTHREVWQHFGSLASHVQRQWITLLAGSDLVVRESLLRKVEAMRVELEGASPSPVERLLCESVVVTWLESEYFSVLLAASGDRGTPREVESLQIRRDGALKRHLAAVKSLAETRKLLRVPPPRDYAVTTPVDGTTRSRRRTTSASTGRSAPGPGTIPIAAKYRPKASHT